VTGFRRAPRPVRRKTPKEPSDGLGLSAAPQSSRALLNKPSKRRPMPTSKTRRVALQRGGGKVIRLVGAVTSSQTPDLSVRVSGAGSLSQLPKHRKASSAYSECRDITARWQEAQKTAAKGRRRTAPSNPEKAKKPCWPLFLCVPKPLAPHSDRPQSAGFETAAVRTDHPPKSAPAPEVISRGSSTSGGR